MSEYMQHIVDRKWKKIFSFKNKSERIEHDAMMLQYYFLSEFEAAMEQRKMTKAQLARKLKCSASWLTQVWRGDKKLTLLLAVKISYTLGLNISISSTPIK